MAALATVVKAESSEEGWILLGWAGQGIWLFNDHILPLPFSCWQSLAGPFVNDRGRRPGYSLVKHWTKEGTSLTGGGPLASHARHSCRFPCYPQRHFITASQPSVHSTGPLASAQVQVYQGQLSTMPTETTCHFPFLSPIR